MPRRSVKPDLLVIVPTKSRPHLIQRLTLGVFGKAEHPELIDIEFVLSPGQEALYTAEIENLPRSPKATVVTPDLDSYPGKINHVAAQRHLDYKYFAILNDEHEPQTAHWDTEMKAALAADPFGVAYAPDGIWEAGQVPAGPMVSSSMFAALGWIALPGLHHILIDNVWMDLAIDCGTLHWLPDVRIQHHHRQLGAEDDATYRETNDNRQHMDEDRDRYFAWVDSDERRANVAALKALWT